MRIHGGRVVTWFVAWGLIGWLAGEARAAERVAVDAAFPGGNVLVDKIDGDDVFVRQDLRDTTGFWFYWQFRVTGAAGRTIRFHFTAGNVLGSQGPCYSLDRGANWQWLGPKRSNTGDVSPRDGFVFRFPDAAEEVRFCLSIPYQESDLKRFLKRHEGNASLKTDVLCKTAGGRDVERLTLGRLDGGASYRLAFTCRHHACESVASYVLEGLLDVVLADDATGRWFREHGAIFVVPMIDKDGVEAGDQGKNRKPHDHNRDYAGEPIYPVVAAIKKTLPEWSGGKLDVAIDFHCPGLGGAAIEFIGGPEKEIWRQVLVLSETLQKRQRGPLRHETKHNVPFGSSWNQGAALRGASFGAWARSLPKVRIGTTIETPYSQAGATVITTENARSLGRDLAEALRIYLEQSRPQAGAVE